MQLNLLLAPSPLDPQSFITSDMILKKHFEPGAMAGTSLGHFQSLDQQSSDHYLNGSIFSMKDDTDLNEELMHIMANPNFQQVVQVSPQSFPLTYLTRGCETEISHGPRIAIQSEQDKIESFLATPSCASNDSNVEIYRFVSHKNENQDLSCIQPGHDKTKLSPSTSAYASANLDNIAIIESFPNRNETGLSYDDQRGEYNNTAMENIFEHLPEIPDSLMEFSQWSNPMCVNDNNGDQGLYCKETPAIQMDQVSNALYDKFTCDDDDHVIIDNMKLDHWKEQPLKKRRLLR